MKRINISILLSAFISFIIINSYAANTNELIIINHFNKPLTYMITINPTTLPDFSTPFALNPGEQIKSKVLPQKEAYIHTEDDEKHSGFFGVNIVNGKTIIHGYLSKGIAFSWKNETITFCTPDEYKKNHSCK